MQYTKALHRRTHHNKIKSRVGDSCLFQRFYSGKVAGTIIAVQLPSFTKKGVSSVKQKK